MTNVTSVQSKIAKGAMVNFIGMISKVIGGPILYIFLTRLYGKAPMGLFFVAYNIIEIAGGFAIAGFVDSAMLFTSRHMHKESDQDLLYSYLRYIFTLTIGIGFLMCLLGIFGAPLLNKYYYSDYPALTKLLQIMAFMLPLEALTRLAVTIPKAKLNMHYEVIVIGGVAPLSTIALTLLFWYFDWGVIGIAISFTLTFIITLIVALFLLSRVLDLKKLLTGSFNKKVPKGIWSFVIPQNLNMALNRFISTMDIIMLAGFGFPPAQITFYALGAQIVRNGRQIRLIFSGSYAPVIARFHHEKRYLELNKLFSTVIGWIISLAIPVLFIMAYFRHDLLLLFSSEFKVRPDFMLILLISPFWNCATGLYGNAIVMSGYSKWNLVNSLTVGITNFLLNLILIPRYGLYGAAIATATAISLVSIMQIIEARILVGIKLPFRTLIPWLTIGIFLFLPPFFFPGVNISFINRFSFAAIPLIAYIIIYWKFRHRINKTQIE
jgi:O-antigen/teichoic acid export membrane protein